MNRIRRRVAATVVGISAVFTAGLLAPAFGGSLTGGLDFEIHVPTTPVSPGDAVDAFGVVKNLNQEMAIEGPIDVEFGAAAAPNSLSGSGWACSFPPPACTTAASIPANEALPAIELTFTVPSSGVDFNPWYRCDQPDSQMCMKISGIAFAPRPEGGASGSDEFDLPISAPVANLDVAVAADAIEAGRPAKYRFTVSNVGASSVDGPIGILLTTGPPGLSNASVGPSSGWNCDFSRTASELYVCERPGSLAGGESAPPLELTWNTSRDAADFPCEGDPCVSLTTVPRAGGVTGLARTDRRQVTGPPALALSDGGASFADGETGTYTVSLNNVTALPFWIGTNVVLTPSAGLSFSGFRDGTGTWSCASWEDGQISCELVQALEPGQSSPTLEIDFDVRAPFETTACTEVAAPCVQLAAWLPTLDIRVTEQTAVGGSGPAPTPSISIGDVSVTEGDSGSTNAVFTVSLSQAASSVVTVNFATADGTASAGTDYSAMNGLVSFAAGETSKAVAVPILVDTTLELNETFSVNLSNSSGAPIADAAGIATILDDDASLPTPVVTEPAEGAVVTDTRVPTLRGTFGPDSPAGVTVELYVDGLLFGEPAPDANGNWLYSPPSVQALADGPHALRARARNSAGKSSPFSPVRTFTINTVTLPVPVISQPSEGAVVSEATPTLQGSAGPDSPAGVIIEVYVDGVVVGEPLPDANGQWSYSLSALQALADGPHTVRARALYSTWNSSPLSPVRNFSVDTSPRPLNDAFADAEVLDGPSGTRSGTVVGASRESGEPSHVASTCSGGGNRTVWYRLTLAATSGVSLSFSHPVGAGVCYAVYTGSSLGGLTLVANWGGRLNDGLPFATGTTLRIAVTDIVGLTPGSFDLGWELTPPPANDAFADAEVLSGPSGTTNGTVVAASREPGEPSHVAAPTSCPAGDSTVWYRLTLASASRISLDLGPTGTAGCYAVYTGSSLSTLTLVTARYIIDEGAPPLAGGSPFAAGTTFQIAVTNFAGQQQQSFDLGWEITPANDAFADAAVLSGPSGTTSGTVAGAEREPGEPSHSQAGVCTAGDATVWYRLTLATPSRVSISSTVSAVGADGCYAAYTGSSLGALTLVSAGALGSSGPLSNTMLHAGTTLQIAVTNRAGAPRGSFGLSWALGDESVAQAAAAGATVTTDREVDGATPSDPVETAVTTPYAGVVTIVEQSIPNSTVASFAFLGQQVSITAPPGTVTNPLKLVFRIDASLLAAGIDLSLFTVFRNGVAVAGCSGTAGTAAPDPCLSSTTLLADGDLEAVILTSAASEWTFALRLYDFAGFFSPVDNLPTLNSVNAGRAIPVKFSLGGDQGLEIFDAGYPKAQQIACDSSAPVDGVEETVTAGASSLAYDAVSDRYTYVWKTDPTWAGTCRQLVLKLADGTSQRANFKVR